MAPMMINASMPKRNNDQKKFPCNKWDTVNFITYTDKRKNEMEPRRFNKNSLSPSPCVSPGGAKALRLLFRKKNNNT